MIRIAGLFALLALAIPLAAQMGRGWGGGRCCAAGNQWQAGSPAPIAANPVVDISGVIGLVQIVPGEGTPYLEVKHGNETTKVYLGPMHYLIAQDFSPKTGQEVSLTGYKQTDSVVAIQVTLSQEKKTLKLRDDSGRPLWRGGPWRGGRGRMMGGQAGPPK